MEIQIDDLHKRGFTELLLSPGVYKKYAHPYYFTYRDNIMSVNFGSQLDEQGEYIEIPVLNCKNITDLDNLLNLFK